MLTTIALYVGSSKHANLYPMAGSSTESHETRAYRRRGSSREQRQMVTYSKRAERPDVAKKMGKLCSLACQTRGRRTDVPEALRSTALKSICSACRMRMTSPHSPRKKASTRGTLTEAKYSSSYSRLDIMVSRFCAAATMWARPLSGRRGPLGRKGLGSCDAPAKRAALSDYFGSFDGGRFEGSSSSSTTSKGR